MVSGTIAHKRRMAEKKSAEFRKSRISFEKTRALKENRKEVIAEICALFGWKELDPFAKEMVDKAVTGKIVNIKQLKDDIAEWKKSQDTLTTESVTKEVSAVEKEETANGDKEIQ
jgi:hypothetical protein